MSFSLQLCVLESLSIFGLIVFYITIYGRIWVVMIIAFFFFKQKTAYEMRISDWSSDVCSSDLFYDVAVEVGKRAFFHANHLAHFEQHLGAGFFDTLFHLGEDFLDFFFGNRRGTVTRATQKAGDSVGVLDQEIGRA